ncbi:MAG: EAL domain-containing protein [Candidatus Sedimenticola endophacoides]
MHYQPIRSFGSGHTVGFEALVRWNDSQHMTSPAVCIPLAEESNLIHPLGHWIFRQVLAQLKAWDDAFDLPQDFKVAVNVSPRHFADRALVEWMLLQLGEYGLPASRLAIELTETAIFQDRIAVLSALTRLRDSGISIHLDDFGTGYSSLSYLGSFPISAIKIDRSSISAMRPGGRHERMVGSLITMARELDILVIAEGVEQARQLEYLRRKGCDFAQGFHIGRPESAVHATRRLTGVLDPGRPGSACDAG